MNACCANIILFYIIIRNEHELKQKRSILNEKFFRAEIIFETFSNVFN